LINCALKSLQQTILNADAHAFAYTCKYATHAHFARLFTFYHTLLIITIYRVSLGQGQGPYATELVAHGAKTGNWVLLQNCMLAKSWMPALEQIVLKLAENSGINNTDFRLYLTSTPATYFPVSILQNGVKMTNEPPKGVRANVSRSWSNLIKSDDWAACPKPNEYKKLLVGLLFFHANIQERRKFGPLGWNIQYAFDESDLETSIAVLGRFLHEDAIPWDALRFVTGQINYGGRVTDDWDRRCLTSILSIYVNESIVKDGYKFSASGIYYAPPAGPYDDVATYFSTLPTVDNPEIFGMHQNANLTFNTSESVNLMTTILGLQPRESGSGGGLSNDDIVIALADAIEPQVPALLLDEEAGSTTFIVQSNGLLGSLAIVLKQEMVKFNTLLSTIVNTISELKKAVRGLVVMSSDLDKMYTSFLINRVPGNWSRVSFASMKSLSSWVKDLVFRVSFMRQWLQCGQPATFPLPVFFFPQGFMTGTLQTYARKYQVAIDTLSFKYDVMKTQPEDVLEGPVDGIYCYGLWLEGARWCYDDWMLKVSRQGEMCTQLPLIHFIPATGHKSSDKDYACPVYKTAERKGVLSTTGMSTNFVVAVELPTDVTPSTWVLYGVAALLNLTD
jgi:dynein heavy chain, axonemal